MKKIDLEDSISVNHLFTFLFCVLSVILHVCKNTVQNGDLTDI